MSQINSTRVLAVLACCPPGPPEPVKRHWSSSLGIRNVLVTTMSVPAIQEILAWSIRCDVIIAPDRRSECLKWAAVAMVLYGALAAVLLARSGDPAWFIHLGSKRI